jgi:hypothetical protein
MRIPIRNLFDPGSRTRDGKIGIRDPGSLSRIRNTALFYFDLRRNNFLALRYSAIILFLYVVSIYSQRDWSRILLGLPLFFGNERYVKPPYLIYSSVERHSFDADPDPDPIPSFTHVGNSLNIFCYFYSQQWQSTLFYLSRQGQKC